jgi:PAS domain S-box-containing protein
MTTEARSTERAQAAGEAPTLDRAADLVPVFDIEMARVERPGWIHEEPVHRELLQALGVAVYTTDPDGRITFYNESAADFWGRRPDLGELWCGSWRLLWPDGRPMAHEECPMAIALKEGREVRGWEAIAERPDGSRVSFTPYPTLLHGNDGRVIGAVNVLVDVTPRRQAEDALRASAEALRASNAVKDEFLGLVSHELRTPVTTIFGNARLLRDRGERLSRENRVSMIDDIADDAERLLGVIENLLTLTRLESGVHADPEPQVLAHVVKTVVDSFSSRHRDRPIELHGEPRHLIVDADGPYLELLLTNLLSNADKYSPADEPIEVVLRSTGAHAEVLVLDRGIGLAGADPARLFTAFYRTEDAQARSGGLGIGLAACKRVVETLGGRIWAEPRDGGGSEFGFALPLASALNLS